jgi:SPP1 gp7 family putative phage head morphogenesis protein
MQDLLTPYLKTKGAAVAEQAAALLSRLGKSPRTDEFRRKIDALLDEIDLDWSDLPADVAAILSPFASDAATDAMRQIDVNVAAAVDLSNDRAAEWAADRAAELVGMKWVDGELVPNPAAEWVITDSTREMLRGNVTQAIEEGWSNDRLADSIREDEAFSESRAMTIARTETAMADVEGNLIAYRAAEESGIDLRKEWITAGDDLVTPDCKSNGEQGPIPLSSKFQSGVDAPPDHPNCRCDVLPVRFQTDSEGE